jgi:hypothetical protein
VLVVTVTLSGSLPTIAALDVTLTGAAAETSENQYTAAGGITFPTTFSAQLPARVTGAIRIDVKAIDTNGDAVARGRVGPFTVTAGSRQNVLVRLDCNEAPCVVPGPDGGSTNGPDAASDDDPRCGNGRIDALETCDTAIPAGAPGACPRADCDDGIACTSDTQVGKGCHATCTHEEIRAPVAGDKCCPTGATNADDADCSPHLRQQDGGRGRALRDGHRARRARRLPDQLRRRRPVHAGPAPLGRHVRRGVLARARPRADRRGQVLPRRRLARGGRRLPLVVRRRTPRRARRDV